MGMTRARPPMLRMSCDRDLVVLDGVHAVDHRADAEEEAGLEEGVGDRWKTPAQ